MSSFSPALIALLFLSFFITLSLSALNLHPSSSSGKDHYAYCINLSKAYSLGVDCHSANSPPTVLDLEAWKVDECLQNVADPPLYFKATCNQSSFSVSLGCNSRCENCNEVNYYNFTKNCGMQIIGCGEIPKISYPMLWTQEYAISKTSYNKNDCSSEKISKVTASVLDKCEFLNEMNKYMLTCNATHWESRSYLKQCGVLQIDQQSGRNGICNYNSISYCKSLP